MFDDAKPDWAAERTELRELLDDDAWNAARRTTINAHYTGPDVVEAMWRAVGQLGVSSGRVLEPGCGSGMFIGAAPDDIDMVGIELDATTAAISQAIYPAATVRKESFADTRFPNGHFDAAIGNVPFSDTSLYDPRHNAGGHSMHNHFILKSLDLTRPGGLVAVLTSSYTLDAQNPAARREMHSKADLVGAMRLPAGTHRRSAGTDVITDLLILRRRVDGEAPQPFNWELSDLTDVDGKQVRLNSYFVEHPQRMLGSVSVETNQWGRDTVTVTADDLSRLGEQLRQALGVVVDNAKADGLTATSPDPTQQAERPVLEATQLWDGTIVENGKTFLTARDGQLEPLAVPATQAGELRVLLQLRDQTRQLLELESTTLAEEADFSAERAALRSVYDGYVAKYGPINRFTTRATGKMVDVVDDLGDPVIDPETGEPERKPGIARIQPPVMRLLRRDPFGPLVKALERFDEETQTATPASVLAGRVVARTHQKMGADTPSEAIAIALDHRGRVTVEHVAELLGVDQQTARNALGTLVYDDPATGTIVPAAEYLSGNVRIKLDQARAAATTDPRFDVNVQALTEVLPAPLQISEIQARLGAVWISPAIHTQFVQELLGDRYAVVENPLPGEWKVKASDHGVRATKEWGTSRQPASKIIESLLSQVPITIKDAHRDGDRVTYTLNAIETEAAREKGERIQERFEAWVWEDPERATALAAEFNTRFNSIVLRDYSPAGEHLTLPGLATSITLRPHQRTAVARMLNEPAVGLFHQVGAGKTLEMIVGATELRRLGLIRKPMIVVPNHMLEQFSREWLQAYPRASVLAAGSSDLTKDQRREFIARAAANDWDGIVITQSAFKSIGVSRDVKADYIREEIDLLESALNDAGSSGGATVKKIEDAKQKREEDLKKALAVPHDPGLTFEAMGVDYLVVDEAHMYKNLTVPSKIPGAGKAKGSNAAIDLHMKLGYLRSRHGERVATLATATPLPNSISEAYVMQRYLRPDQLEAAGLTSFDGWAATFAETVSSIEVSPTGQFRLKSRFSKFQNVPELLRMFHVFADVKTADDLNLPTPEIAARRSDGKREVETVVVDPTPELMDYVRSLGDRAERIAARAVTPDEDNMLKISSDGRAAALDMRLIDPDSAPTGKTKIEAVADRVADVWNRTRDNEYRLDNGEPSPVRGGLQLVFSDLGTPKDQGWSAYGELKRQLVERGMPGNSIRYIHEAKSDAEKSAMFAAARAGHIAVLIGSTQKMGVGTNVQDRVTALHHVDCPWRPADVEQRDGRAIRQGNQNPEVEMYRYVVERSFDAYMWQIVTQKATFIAQVMRGRLDSREIEDVGDTVLSTNETRALASGNPLILEQAEADTAWQKLHRQEIAHQREQNALYGAVDHARAQIATKSAVVDQLEHATTRTTNTTGDRFHMTIGDRLYTSRTEAAGALLGWVNEHTWDWIRSELTLGAVGGHDIRIRVQRDFGELKAYVSLADVPLSGSTLTPADIGLGDIRTLENKTTNITRNLDRTRDEITALAATIDEITPRLGQAFPKADALAVARERLDQVNQQIAKLSTQDRDTTAHETLVDAPGRPPAATSPRQPSEGTRAMPKDAIMRRVEQHREARAGAPARVPVAPRMAGDRER